jgi:hypothetical protein
MRHLSVDPRGYAIPCLVAIDEDGRARFTINDEVKRQRVIRHDLCSICGQPLNVQRWFCGGPQSAFHEHGAYLDPPMHSECLHYALTVCPYLALPGYRSVIANLEKLAEKFGPIIDNTMLDERPNVFVAVRSNATTRTMWDDLPPLIRYVRPRRPYQRIEYWRHGVRLDDATGEALTRAALAAPLPELTPTKLVIPVRTG